MNKRLVCPKHLDLYSNYCLICMEALCPSCIEHHYKVHRDTGEFRVEPFRNVQTTCISKIVKLRDLVSQEIKKIDTDRSQFNANVLFERVMAIKKSMVSEVNKIVESRLRDIEIIESQHRKIEIKKPCMRAARVINDFLARLDINHPNVIETIQHVVEFNDNEFVKLFYKELNDNFARILSRRCQIVYDQIRYRNLLEECFKIVNPYEGSVKESMTQPKLSLSQDDFENNVFKKYLPEPSNVKSQPFDILNQTVKKPDQLPDIHPLQIKSFDEMSDTIVKGLSPPNEFQVPLVASTSQKTFLHYFEPDSANFHTISLQGFKHRVTQLNFPFPVPLYHKSIQLPTGSILLTGGKLFNGKKNTKIFNYSIERSKLREYCQVLPRSSHAICYHKENLYIMGGFGQLSIEKNVQKLSLGEKVKISLVRPSKFGGFCTATAFNDMIVKLCNEGVEVYSTIQDQWNHVVLKNFVYFQNCGTIRTNQNEIFVFGGYDEAERGVRNSYTLYFSDKCNNLLDFNSANINICRQNKFPLPKGEGFEDNTVEFYNGKLYALQNIIDQTNQCVDSQRTLLSFNGKGWEIIQLSN